MEKIDKNIQNLKKTYISLNELEQLVEPSNYMELVEKINQLISDGIIRPIKNKRNTNGKIPSLFVKYRIIKNQEEVEELEKEIKHLSPELKIGKYLNNQETYKNHRKELKKLDEFLKNKKEKLKTKISKNERAYQIWGYEKMLDTQLGKSIVNFNELEEKLNYYLTPEPFFDYILNQKEKMTILIIENKDTWYTLRKIAKDNNLRKINILETEIDGLIYGEGNKITKYHALEEYEKEMLNTQAEFIYWGDLDFTGIDMYERVKKANTKCNINLFTSIYEKMLELSKNRNLENISKEQNKNINLEDFLNSFKNLEIREELMKILQENKYIPQEILNYEEIQNLLLQFKNENCL